MKKFGLFRGHKCVYEFYATKHKNESAPCVLLGLLDLSKKNEEVTKFELLLFLVLTHLSLFVCV